MRVKSNPDLSGLPTARKAAVGWQAESASEQSVASPASKGWDFRASRLSRKRENPGKPYAADSFPRWAQTFSKAFTYWSIKSGASSYITGRKMWLALTEALPGIADGICGG